MKYGPTIRVFVGLVLFLTYAGFHSGEIAPDFFAEIIPLVVLHILSCLAGVILTLSDLAKTGYSLHQQTADGCMLFS